MKIEKIINESLTNLNESSVQKDSLKLADGTVISWGWEKGHNGGLWYVEKSYKISDSDELYQSKFHRTYATEGEAKNAYDRLRTKDMFKKEDLDKNPLEGIRSNILDFPSGDYVYVGYEDGKLYAGNATNTGIFHTYEIDYDWDESVDTNLQNLYYYIIDKNPEFGIPTEEEITEDYHPVRKPMPHINYNGELDPEDLAITEDVDEEEIEEKEDKVIFKQLPDDQQGRIDFSNEIQETCEITGAVITGNSHLLSYGDQDYIDIINGDYEDEDVGYDYEPLEELKKITGVEYQKTQITGYSQSDWNNLYYQKGTNEDVLNWLETFYMGKYDEFINDESEILAIPHDIVWKGSKAIKEYISKEFGYDVDKLVVKKFKDYTKIANYDDFDESLNEAKVGEFVGQYNRVLTQEEIDKFVDVIKTAATDNHIDTTNMTVDTSKNVKNDSPFSVGTQVIVTIPVPYDRKRRIVNKDTLTGFSKIIFTLRAEKGYSDYENHKAQLDVNKGQDKEDFDMEEYTLQATTNGTVKPYYKQYEYRFEGHDHYMYNTVIEEFAEDVDHYLHRLMNNVIFATEPFSHNSGEYTNRQVDSVNETIEMGDLTHKEWELYVYIINDRSIYDSAVKTTINNLKNKVKKGTYDENLAVKAFEYVVVAGLKKYRKDNPGEVEMYSAEEKENIAKQLVNRFEDEIKD